MILGVGRGWCLVYSRDLLFNEFLELLSIDQVL